MTTETKPGISHPEPLVPWLGVTAPPELEEDEGPFAHVLSHEEIAELGILQEANRLFFHPLRLSLGVVDNGAGETHLAVFDHRRDDGIRFSDTAIAAADTLEKARKVGEMRVRPPQSIPTLENEHAAIATAILLICRSPTLLGSKPFTADVVRTARVSGLTIDDVITQARSQLEAYEQADAQAQVRKEAKDGLRIDDDVPVRGGNNGRTGHEREDGPSAVDGGDRGPERARSADPGDPEVKTASASESKKPAKGLAGVAELVQAGDYAGAVKALKHKQAFQDLIPYLEVAADPTKKRVMRSPILRRAIEDQITAVEDLARTRKGSLDWVTKARESAELVVLKTALEILFPRRRRKRAGG
jgi:hypothetical protein